MHATPSARRAPGLTNFFSRILASAVFLPWLAAAPAHAADGLQISGTPATSVVAGSLYSFVPTVTSPHQRRLTFVVRSKPYWATFSTTTGELSGTPSSAAVGTYGSIVIGVSDGLVWRFLPSYAVTVQAAGTTTTPAPAPTPPTPSPPTGSPGQMNLTSAVSSVSQSSGSVLVSIARTGGTTGAVSVNYNTVDGTARAGTDYATTSGTLGWADGDASTKSVSIPVTTTPGFDGTRAFALTISGPTGGATLATTTDTITIQGAGATSTPPPSSSSASLSIQVQGSHLINGSGATVQLRGADVSALEFVAIQGWSPSDPWGGQAPNWAALKSWNINAVRIPLNEASWLGLTTYDWPTGSQTAGTARQADPGNNYQQTVINAVNAAISNGIYVILDLHLSSPDAVVPGVSGKVPTSPTAQNVMADADHSVAFWTSVANTFKNNPAVIFDLFNEPHIDGFQNVTGYRDPTAWIALRDGGTATQFTTNGVTVNQTFPTVGMQALLNAVRATGASNVVMVGGISWAQDLSQWTTYAPSDPLHQLAASWHAYPQGFSGTAATIPGYGTDNYTWASSILAAGYPVIVGETGDHSAAGTVGAPFMANFLPWVDQTGVSVLGWTWDAWGAPDDDLIKDASGTPSDGYGQAYHTWTVNHP